MKKPQLGSKKTKKSPKTSSSSDDGRSKAVQMLEELGQKYLVATQKLAAWRRMNKPAFSREAQWRSRLEALDVAIKPLARTLLKAGSGETIKPVDLPGLYIQVNAPQAKPTFDVEKARKHLPTKIQKLVLYEAIDGERLLDLLAHGRVSPELVKKCQLKIEEEDLPTIRVTIKSEEKI